MDAIDVLKVTRVNSSMRALDDRRQLPQDLIWSARIPETPATDAEILARFTQRVQIADLVADDQAAVTYSNGKLTYETSTIPNIKIGINFTQAELNALQAYADKGGQLGADDPFLNWQRTSQEAILLGIRQRKEALLVGMLNDGLTYDRLGIKMTGVTFGMPSDLKVSLSGGDTWDTPSTSKPVTQIRAIIRTGRVRYGITFDRLTMSLPAFDLMIATDEFKAKAVLYMPNNVTYGALPTTDSAYMQNLARNVLGVKEIEITDSRYWTESPLGTMTSAPFQPLNNVLFTSTSNDGNGQAMDWADSIVTESIVGSIFPGLVQGSFSGPQRGPVSYVTGTDNPPSATIWGVKRGFPRKKIQQSSAVLTVGTVTETIAVGEPF